MKRLFILFLAASLLILNACSNADIIYNIDKSPLFYDEFSEDTEEKPMETPAINEEAAEYAEGIYKTIGDKNLSFDLLLPTVQKFEKAPLIVGFHGGGWITGSKSQISFLFSPVISGLRENGYAVAAVQYRLADSQTRFPAPFDDCADFINYIKENAGLYNIDAGNIGVLGYSAGAHLAMLCAYAADLDLRYCVSLAGPTKLYGDDPANYPRSTMSLVESLFGKSYEENEDLYKSGSPYFYLERADYKNVPLLLVHDEADAVVPYNQSEIMLEKAASLNIESGLVTLSGFGHDIYFSRADSVTQEIINFIYKFYKNY